MSPAVLIFRLFYVSVGGVVTSTELRGRLLIIIAEELS